MQNGQVGSVVGVDIFLKRVVVERLASEIGEMCYVNLAESLIDMERLELDGGSYFVGRRSKAVNRPVVSVPDCTSAYL